MKKKIKYTDEKIGKIEIIEDFLPKPEELVFREDTVTVKLKLSRSSVEFFKQMAEKYGSNYQKMIKLLLDKYASQFTDR
jgi:predicted DNA binding CopG/RHH family protein